MLSGCGCNRLFVVVEVAAVVLNVQSKQALDMLLIKMCLMSLRSLVVELDASALLILKMAAEDAR